MQMKFNLYYEWKTTILCMCHDLGMCNAAVHPQNSVIDLFVHTSSKSHFKIMYLGLHKKIVD